jgi:predicted amidohydrolase
MRILGIPYRSREGRVSENVHAALKIIREEMEREPVDLVVLPELFTCGYCAQDLRPYAESLDSPTMELFRRHSEALNVLIGYGFAELTGERRVYNSWALVEPHGALHVYRKTHLVSAQYGAPNDEREFLLPGEELAPFDTRLGRMGVMICYDGCFVEVPRALVLRGADLILWPCRSSGYLAKISLPQVRAMDNIVPVVQVDGGQTGDHFPSEGWSIVASELGKPILSQRADTTPFRVHVDVERSSLLRQSSRFPAVEDWASRDLLSLYETRRTDLYGVISERE